MISSNINVIIIIILYQIKRLSNVIKIGWEKRTICYINERFRFLRPYYYTTYKHSLELYAAVINFCIRIYRTKIQYVQVTIISVFT